MLLQSTHIEVVEQVIWGIGNIAGDSPTTRNRVIESGALDSISRVLQQAPAGTSFMRNASWALSNLCRGRPQPDYNLVKGAIPTLIKVLVENDKEDIITDYIDKVIDPFVNNLLIKNNVDVYKMLISFYSISNIHYTIIPIRYQKILMQLKSETTSSKIRFKIMDIMNE